MNIVPIATVPSATTVSPRATTVSPRGASRTATPQSPKHHSSSFQEPQSTLAFNIDQLWDELERKNKAAFSNGKVRFVDFNQMSSNRFGYPCPLDTCVRVNEQYLNANRVGEGVTQRSFVASQAPLIKEYNIFWKAIFESDCNIFDLTTEEDQKGNDEAERVTGYYPINDTPMLCDSLTITLTDRVQKNSTWHHTYRIVDQKTKKEKTIERLHYLEWPDNEGIPSKILDELVQKILDVRSKFWIHCRSGVGRTGTLIAAAILKEKILNREITQVNLKSSLSTLVMSLRTQRGPKCIRKAQLGTLVQYAKSAIPADS